MTNARAAHARPSRLRSVMAAALAAALLAACGNSYRAPEAVILPPEVTTSTTADPNLQECDGKTPVPAAASYAPLEALPAPGSPMPPGSYMETIQRRGKLIVGTSIDTNLFSSVNPASNQIEGFDVDMARLVARAIFGDDLAGRVELRGITYAQRIPLVVNGEVDIVAHTMTINCRRWQQVAFSEVYLWAGQKLLVSIDSDVEQVEDLAGQTVCVSAGGTSAEEMAALAVSPPIKPLEVNNQTDCVVAFQRGEADAIRSDDTVLAGFAAQDPFSKVVGDPLTEEPYGMATGIEHPEFTRFVNAVLAQAKADTGPNGWQAAYDRWLATPLGQPLASLAVPAEGEPQFSYGIPVADYSRPIPQG